MVSAAEAPDRVDEHSSFVDAAAAAGVEQLVYISFAARRDAIFTLGRDHWATEQHIEASGMAWTFLRDNLYPTSSRSWSARTACIRGPAGDGRVAAVATDDVADAAAAVLLDPGAHAARPTPSPAGGADADRGRGAC